MKRTKAKIVTLVVFILLSLTFFSCQIENNDQTDVSIAEETPLPLSGESLKLIADKDITMANLVPDVHQRSEDYIRYNLTKEVNLMAVGDIMVHKVQLMAAYDKASDTYNFDEQFAYIKEEFDKADLVFGNFETVTAGIEKVYSGANMIFNAPDSIISAIDMAGFDVVSTTNNHTLDRGFFGLSRTIDQLDQAGIEYVGTKKNENEVAYKIIEVEGLKIGFLAYAENFNGWTLDEDKTYAANLLILEQAVADIKMIADQVDIVIVSAHWGHEYFDDPYKTQVKIGRALVDAGAHVVLGHHPHVLQPIEKHGQGYIVYSMGNFVSGQRTSPRDHGMIVNLKLIKNKYQDAEVGQVSMLPTYVQSSYKDNKPYMRVLSMDAWIDKYENDQIDFLPQNQYLRMKKINHPAVLHVLGETSIEDVRKNSLGFYILN